MTTPLPTEDKTPHNYSTDLGEQRNLVQSDPRNLSENVTK